MEYTTTRNSSVFDLVKTFGMLPSLPAKLERSEKKSRNAVIRDEIYSNLEVLFNCYGLLSERELLNFLHNLGVRVILLT